MTADPVVDQSPGVADPPSLDALADSIVATAGRLAAATCHWLLQVAEFDSREGAHTFGLATTSRWLAHHCSLAQRTAEDHVRVARTLATHPQLVAEMSAGRLSYSHVRAISRLAKPEEPALVDDLINVAEYGTVQHLETMVRGLRTVRDNLDDAGEPPAEYVTYSISVAGQHRTTARLDPERGALFESAVTALARAEDLTVPDAFVRLAEIGLAAVADHDTRTTGRAVATTAVEDAAAREAAQAHEDVAPTGHDADPADRVLRRRERRRVARMLRGDEQAAVVVHVDATRLGPNRSRERSLGRLARPGRPGSPDGAGLPPAVVERLLCHGRIRTVLRDGADPRSNVLDLGRSQRLVSNRQYRALLLRDGGCLHPGCRSHDGLEAHHVRHWIDGGVTDLANLILLCRAHHHAHHDGEFRIEATDAVGRFRFFRADGRELLEHVDLSSAVAAGTPSIETEHDAVARTAARTQWGGEHLERDWAIACLAGDLTRSPFS